jgi:prephenate dehydrogenase
MMEDNADFKNSTIGIIGLGLIGGSFAMSIKKKYGSRIFALDRNKKILSSALERKIIDEYFDNGEEFLDNCDIVIIALYPQSIVNFIENNMKFFKRNSIIMDTAGIKHELVTKVQSILREDLEFIGTHPMCGKEESGFEAAESRIFENSNYIITPTDKNTDKNLNVIKSLIKSIGCKNVIELSTKEHDEIIAYTSQLPHVLAVALMNSCDYSKQKLKTLIGGSYRDATRVAAINGELWCDLLINNSDNLLSAIDKFEEQLKFLKDAVENKDKLVLMKEFEHSYNLRKEIG